MRKTAKNSTRKEYIEMCKYYDKERFPKYNPFNRSACTWNGELVACIPYCPRMRRYDRIQQQIKGTMDINTSTFEEYRQNCPFFEDGVFHIYCHNKDLYKGEQKTPICFGRCPRMKRWERIHKND